MNSTRAICAVVRFRSTRTRWTFTVTATPTLACARTAFRKAKCGTTSWRCSAWSRFSTAALVFTRRRSRRSIRWRWRSRACCISFRCAPTASGPKQTQRTNNNKKNKLYCFSKNRFILHNTIGVGGGSSHSNCRLPVPYSSTSKLPKP